MSQVMEVSIGKQGRVVIPAELRRLLDFQEGDKLVAREEAGRLILEKREVAHQRLQSLLAHLPKERSIVDELIAERREAAKQEAEE